MQYFKIIFGRRLFLVYAIFEIAFLFYWFGGGEGKTLRINKTVGWAYTIDPVFIQYCSFQLALLYGVIYLILACFRIQTQAYLALFHFISFLVPVVRPDLGVVTIFFITVLSFAAFVLNVGISVYKGMTARRNQTREK